MGFLSHLSLGFTVAVSPVNLLYCFIGVVLGTLIGVLPGIGPIATMAILLPATFALEPVTALIMLAGIYYGAQYGGSTSAILLKLPGESSSVITTIDGYQMALNGEAGLALSVAAIGSFVAGTVGTLFLGAFAPVLTTLAIRFGAAEYFALMVLGLISAVVLSSGSLLKALSMIVLGLLFGIVGTDINSGVSRFTFGIADVASGLSFAVVALGLFGIAEILVNLEVGEARTLVVRRLDRLWPTLTQLRQALPPILRGTGIGCLLGVLPGGGVTMAAFGSYALEKRIARDPGRFGHGALEGVAGPESANNAAAQTSFIPLLTLGLPSNGVMAMMMSAMTLHNVRPGPQVITSSPELFWGLVASMWIGNLMLVILNLPLLGVWVRLLQVPYRLLYLVILLFCCIGIYSIQNSVVDIYIAILFGVIGYALTKVGCDLVPFLLGFILGPMLEDNLRRSMLLSGGDPTVFLRRPLSAFILALGGALLVAAVLPQIRRKRAVVFHEP
jgi:putative tricarboxylic transport membrane protein